GFDFAEFHPMPANLDLMVDAPHELDRSIGPKPAEVSAAVESWCWAAAEVAVDEAFRGELWTLPVATRNAVATDIDFAYFAELAFAPVLAHDVDLCIPDGCAYGDCCARADPRGTRPDRGRGWSVHVQDFPRDDVAQGIRQRGGQGLAADQERAGISNLPLFVGGVPTARPLSACIEDGLRHGA